MATFDQILLISPVHLNLLYPPPADRPRANPIKVEPTFSGQNKSELVPLHPTALRINSSALRHYSLPLSALLPRSSIPSLSARDDAAKTADRDHPRSRALEGSEKIRTTGTDGEKR